jgi:hypothetical protein
VIVVIDLLDVDQAAIHARGVNAESTRDTPERARIESRFRFVHVHPIAFRMIHAIRQDSETAPQNAETIASLRVVR